MKVSTFKNIDVEVEVDVSLEDCIAELHNMANDGMNPRRLIQAVDGATKILEKITPDMVADLLTKNAGALHLIRERLQKWIDAV